jgi:hypothetical protein
MVFLILISRQNTYGVMRLISEKTHFHDPS